MGLLAATSVLVWLLPGRRRRVAAVAGAVAAVLLIAGLMGPIGARLSPHASGPLVMLLDRWRVWSVAVAMAVDHPLFGIGVANFENFYAGYSGHRFGLNHAHNLFLNIAAERGIPALLAFGALVFSLFKLLASHIRPAESLWNRALVVGLVASFAAYLVHSLFEVSYYDYKVLLLFWLLMGLAASLPRVLASRATEAIRREEVAV
jgi:O-antigen ligase